MGTPHRYAGTVWDTEASHHGDGTQAAVCGCLIRTSAEVAKVQIEEPGAGKLQAGICAGGGAPKGDVPTAMETEKVRISEEVGIPTSVLSIRGYLLHITHYDPAWVANKDNEEPFNLEVGLQVIDAMTEVGLNLLLIDPKDGVRYATHPELARPYSQDIEVLRRLTEHAAKQGIETAIKLNFSQSARFQHNHWFRPHNNLFDTPEYWKIAFEIIDELLDIVRPPRFFHVGMDEDHDRSYGQYVKAIKTLRGELLARNLRTLIWNDSACHWPQAAIHRDKSLEAERQVPKDVIHVLWDYGDWDVTALSRIRERGFDLWGAPGGNPELVAHMCDGLQKVGGIGVLLTHWIPCVSSRREELLERIRVCGPCAVANKLKEKVYETPNKANAGDD